WSRWDNLLDVETPIDFPDLPGLPGLPDLPDLPGLPAAGVATARIAIIAAAAARRREPGAAIRHCGRTIRTAIASQIIVSAMLTPANCATVSRRTLVPA